MITKKLRTQKGRKSLRRKGRKTYKRKTRGGSQSLNSNSNSNSKSLPRLNERLNRSPFKDGDGGVTLKDVGPAHNAYQAYINGENAETIITENELNQVEKYPNF